MSAFTDEDYRRVLNERDEWRDKFHALNQTAGELCNACGWAFKIPGESCRCEVIKERDEARAEVQEHREQLRKLPDANRVSNQAAYRRGAEAMREACLGVVERFMDFGSPHPGMIAHKMSALPIPEEP